jgi:S1-C subfamily serine protease
MHKETKTHLIYASTILLLIIVFTTAIIFEQKQINSLEQSLTSQINDLNTNLEQTTTNLNTKITSLESKDTQIQSSLGILDESLKVKEEEIKQLSGDLAEQKIESEKNIEELENTLTNLKIENQDFSGIIDDIIESVVSIQTDVGSGSGFIISTDGLVVTNYHVIEGARAAGVQRHNGDSHRVQIVGFDQDADIALLRIDANNLPTLSFANSNDVRVGEKVIAVGNPAGLDFSVTQGIVSATKRTDNLNNEFIQIDVAINPGNSGGPLINTNGDVIGINTLKIAEFEGLGFAISSNYAQDIIDQIN